MKEPNCKECPFNGQPKILSQINTMATLVIVGESPSINDTIEGHIFSGGAGYQLNKALQLYGFDKSNVSILNATLCRNNKTQKASPSDWKKAVECCNTRVDTELRACSNRQAILCLGDSAFMALTGKAKINPWIGAVFQTPYGKIIPCIHPKMCITKPSLIPVFKHLVKRAIKLANNDLIEEQFTPAILEPPFDTVLDHFKSCKDILGVDVETAGLDPMAAKLLCIGIACTHHRCSMDFHSMDHTTKLKVQHILSTNKLAMHNGQHDILSLESNGFYNLNYHTDTLLQHAIAAPQLHHDLGLVTALETTLPRWKTLFRVQTDAKGAEIFASRDATELREYNSADSQATAIISKRIYANIQKMHKGTSLLETSMNLAKIAIKMRKKGVLCDINKLSFHREELTKKINETRERFTQLCPNVQLGLAGAHKNLKDLFFNTLNCKPLRFSEKTGEPCLDTLTLESYVSYGGKIEAAARLILDLRKHYKLLSVYIDGLQMDEYSIVHPIWKIHGTITGRWSSANPNAQNQPAIMRDLFIPRPGLTIIKADYSQLELRIASLMSGDKYLCDWYANGIDVHTMKAMELAGHKTWSTMDKKEQKAMRNIIKGFNYGVIYGGEPETLWKALVVKNKGVKLALIRELHRKFYEKHTQVKDWQLGNLAFARKNGFIEEKLSGRREYFHDGRIEPNKVLNFPVQAMAGTLMNKAIIEVEKELNWDKETLLFQVHDELVIESSRIHDIIHILKKHMEQTIEWNGRSMKFPVEIKTGINWKDTKEVSDESSI
jgi:uracil-DNA glycosylase family 4